MALFFHLKILHKRPPLWDIAYHLLRPEAVANHFTQLHEHDSEDLRQDLPGLKAGVINEQIGPGQGREQ